jgi:hypothetical protein
LEKSKKRSIIGYGAIINHFGNGNPYKKDDAQQIFFSRRPIVICCQSLHVYFCCQKSVVEALGHVLEFPNYISKLQVNGSTCNPFIGG